MHVSLIRRMVLGAALSVLAVLGAAHWSGAAYGKSPGPEAASARECTIKGRLGGAYDPAHPIRIHEGVVQRDGTVKGTTRDVSEAEYNRIADTPQNGEPNALLASSRVRTRLRTEHAQILMAQLDVYLTWSWNFGTGTISNYGGNDVVPATSGCGWHVTDGPFGWFDPNDMPYAIYSFGWAYFESCSPTGEGWLQPEARGYGEGSWGYYCDYEIVLPWGSSIQCIPTLIY